ncbi:hypothetical protein ASPTUDRAFT_45166 [Aspergillus tubingensis CBS 134.48]|uniref:Uncharacterized protein n=1 Tax=Aspergillus tubingensis (strain CBS 134.48) TaxID=767770 RepID=A0A1L9MXV0_ASPTC|nr:hypothetical protein ASPTUDRAFT_45166 [Aspergillus tubingensis CBS 134.48]
MTVGDPIVHNWRTEDPNTSRRPIMLQVEDHLIVPIALQLTRLCLGTYYHPQHPAFAIVQE